MRWFFIVKDDEDKYEVVTNLYDTPEEAIDAILPSVFENRWEDLSDRLSMGFPKKEDCEDYRKGYIDGKYPTFLSKHNLKYLTHDEMVKEILKDKKCEDYDSNEEKLYEYYLLKMI